MVQQVELLFGTEDAVSECQSEFQLLYYLLIWLPANMPRKQQIMAQVLECLPPTRETWMEFLTPGLSLVQPQLLPSFGK